MSQLPVEAGGSAAAIRHHYDVGNDFFAAWLDPAMVYSCAMWNGLPTETGLEQAQRQKLRYHAQSIGAAAGMRVLDIGCGWGAQMRTLVDEFGASECVGLTLSARQREHIARMADERITAELVNWIDFQPASSFDGIVSVGAFEHFAHPDQDVSERRAIYREFFKRCHAWTDARGRLSLQTIAYGTMRPEEANPFITGEIFPAAELPTLEDIVIASQGLFRIVLLRDDGADYARTCQEWAHRLRLAVEQDGAGFDPVLAERYERYLRLSAIGFATKRIGLLRIRFDPVRGHSRAGRVN